MPTTIKPGDGDAVEEVNIEEIPDGGFFRKLQGEYVFIKVSAPSARFFGLNKNYKEVFFFGVCFNGNMTAMRKGQKVVKGTIHDMAANIGVKPWPQEVTFEEYVAEKMTGALDGD